MLSEALAILKSQAVRYALACFFVAGVLWRVVAMIGNSAVAKEKAAYYENLQEERKREDKIKASVDALSATDARRKLHDKWSSDSK
jgi:hypothetical protein